MKLILEGTPAEIASWQAEQAKRLDKNFLLDANQIARSTGGPGSQGNYYWHGGAGGCDDPTGPVGCIGEPGPSGKSRYQLAVDLGFEGTESEWLISINGEPGQEGPQGPVGQKGLQGPLGRGDPGIQGPIGIVGPSGVATVAKPPSLESEFIVRQLGEFAHNFGTRKGDPVGPKGRLGWSSSENPPSKIDAAIFELLSEKDIKDSDGNIWVPVERHVLDEVIVLLCELNRIKTFES